MSYTDKSNSEIVSEIKLMEFDYNSLKIKIATLLEELENIEKKYNIAKNELKKRGVL